jgi:dihydroxyacetone kinase
VTCSQVVAAFGEGVEAVQKYGGAKAGYRTMLDALLPAEAAMREAAARGSAGADVAAAGATAAAAGAEATKGMAALAGRSSYVPEEVLRSNADPGAKAVSIWLGAVAAALQGA